MSTAFDAVAADEGPHPPSDEALWNESWYFDFVDAAAGLGGWVRLGLYPNEDRAWVNVLLCGPGLPTLALNDFHAALPDDPARVRTAGFSLDLHPQDPARSYRVTATGQAQVYDDPAAALAGTETRSADVSLDLVFDTAGEPYRYQLATRYEIPCTVGGTVVVDGITHTITAAPGQRDHSWGVRDWWAMDWVWFALHLDDGTHLHAVDIRIPGAPHIGIGYAQREGALVELTTVEAREVFGSNGLPISTELVLQPGDLRVATEVVAQAPVRLVNDDGRIADFPRAWMSARTADGRTGVGWMEWNRNPAR